ncbi:unnamed protein product, partial [marine sediment metagenome]
GIKAVLNAPSAKSNLKKLGMVKPSQKASVAIE